MVSHLRAVPDTAPRAIIYLRQSVSRDDSISLELQEIACRDYCDRQGYEVIDVLADPGISGRTWNRPSVQRTMAAIEDHTADVIVLWKWSRLSRSRKDWALAIDRADIAGGRIESATEPIDTATASGRFARGVMTEYAAFQSEQIGEQWEEVRQRRLNMGLPVSGRLPYGWRWAGGGTIESVPTEAAIVVEMYRRYLSGEGPTSISRDLNERGIPAPKGGQWSKTRPKTVMNSPVHAGLIPYRGSTYQGAHEAIIERDTWETYLAVRNTRAASTAAPRKYEHLLVGIIRCYCGQTLHGKGSITGGHWYGGYLCNESKTIPHETRAYVSAKRIDPAVETWFLTFDLPTARAADNTTARAQRDEHLREINALDGELDKLTRQLTREIIPEAAYLRTRKTIEAEINTHRQAVYKLDVTARRTMPADEIREARDLWPEMTIAERNRALRRVIERIDFHGHGAEIITLWGDRQPLTWR